MPEFPGECIWCGTPLKKQVLGLNKFYYCRKCGCTLSTAPASVPALYADSQDNIENESLPGQYPEIGV